MSRSGIKTCFFLSQANVGGLQLSRIYGFCPLNDSAKHITALQKSASVGLIIDTININMMGGK